MLWEQVYNINNKDCKQRSWTRLFTLNQFLTIHICHMLFTHFTLSKPWLIPVHTFPLFYKKQARKPSFAWWFKLSYANHPTQLRTLKPNLDHTLGSTKFYKQNLIHIGHRVPEFSSDIQTNKQRLLLYMNIFTWEGLLGPGLEKYIYLRRFTGSTRTWEIYLPEKVYWVQD